ncbi:hypothetical protein ABEB36_013175 [Hypothenemus hampei]|uniref:HTH CENPB-type domain-containing protein n=1 Tax=Hypothenemus hampei TaxID=57062 RepID=A0ABD1E7E2_HYPHA
MNYREFSRGTIYVIGCVRCNQLTFFEPRTMSKRKHHTLSLKEKQELLKNLDSGQSLTQLAARYDVGKSTISDIKKKRQEILDYTSQQPSTSKSTERSTLKKAWNPEVEEALHSWFLQQRSKGTPISGEILREKAVLLRLKKVRQHTITEYFK